MTLTQQRPGAAMTDQDDTKPELTDIQKAYNVAQSEMFQLAAYGHHRYHPSGECLTDKGKQEQRDYNDRIRQARETLEAAVLRLVAEHGERYRTLPGSVTGWLRTLADDPAELSLLAVRLDERQDIEGRCEGCGEPRNNGSAHGYGAEFGGCV